MNILLVGEGPGDIGREDEESGWLRPLVARILSPLMPIEGITFHRLSRKRILDRWTRSTGKLKLKGHGDLAHLAAVQAFQDGYDAVVVMIDCDSTDMARYTELVANLKAGFATVADYRGGVPCVPMTMSEAWLLADREALFTLGLPTAHTLPKKPPETLWGKRKDPKSHHPHQLFAGVCRAMNLPDSSTTRARIADALSIETLETACPTSFKSFRTALRSACVPA